MREIVIVKGYSRYGVDRDGNTYTLLNGAWRTKKKILGANGYYSIGLWRDNQECRRYVHHLVLEAFIGPRPHGMEALHADGTRTNNSLSNLRWGTRSENVGDMMAHGTATIGSKNAQAKLSSTDTLWIKDLFATGMPVRELVKYFRVSQTTIRRVLTGQTYRKELA